MKRVIVTGGSGRLGRYVVAALSEDHEVTVFDKNPTDAKCRYIEGDILNPASISAALADQDAVIHLAALDADIDATDDEFIKTNVEGTWNLFQCVRETGIGKVVHCSSVAAMNISMENPPQYLPVDTNHPVDPTGAYGLSKLMGEKIARRFAMLGGIDVICLRPSLILPPEYVYDVALTSAKVDGTAPPSPASNPAWISWDEVIPGSRAYVDSRDVAAAFKAALETKGIPWGVFLVTAADTYSGLSTLDVIEREFGAQPEMRDLDRYANGSRASIYDTSETTRQLGWSPIHNWPDLYQEVLGEAWPNRQNQR